MPTKMASSDILQSKVTVVMPTTLREDAHKYGINLSETLRIALQHKINAIKGH